MTHQNHYAFRYTTSQQKMGRMLELLQAPHTRAELAEAMGLSTRAVQCYLAALLAETERRIHIHAWRKNSPGSPSAVYLAGAGKDRKKPKAETVAERSRRRRKDPDFSIDAMQRNRLGRMKPRRDPLVTALFGAA